MSDQQGFYGKYMVRKATTTAAGTRTGPPLTDEEAMVELRKELVQTGAMCLVWVDNIDRDMQESGVKQT